MNPWNYSSEVWRLGLKQYFNNGNNHTAACMKYAKACRPVLLAEVKKVTEESITQNSEPSFVGQKSLLECQQKAPKHFYFQGYFSSVFSGFAFPYPQHVDGTCMTETYSTMFKYSVLYTVLDILSKVQFQINSVETLSCELCFREVGKIKTSSAFSNKLLVFLRLSILLQIYSSICIIFSLCLCFI